MLAGGSGTVDGEDGPVLLFVRLLLSQFIVPDFTPKVDVFKYFVSLQ